MMNTSSPLQSKIIITCIRWMLKITALSIILIYNLPSTYVIVFIISVFISEGYEVLALYLSTKNPGSRTKIYIFIGILNSLYVTFGLLFFNLLFSNLAILIPIVSISLILIGGVYPGLVNLLCSLLIYAFFFFINPDANMFDYMVNIASFTFITLLFSHMYAMYENEEIKRNQLTENIYHSKENNYSQNEFISLSADNLRTPITVLKNFIYSLLTTTPKGSPQYPVYELLNKNINSLAKIIESILMVTQINKFFPQSSVERTKFSYILDNALQRYQQEILKKRITIERGTIDFNDEIVLNMDGITFVIAAILDNALKVSKEDSIISISCILRQNKIYCSIKDWGPGIDEEDKEKLFNMFHKTGNYLINNISGIGLGLYIAKRIIDAHNGEITVESTKGEGSNFTFSIPKASTFSFIQNL